MLTREDKDNGNKLRQRKCCHLFPRVLGVVNWNPLNYHRDHVITDLILKVRELAEWREKKAISRIAIDGSSL